MKIYKPYFWKEKKHFFVFLLLPLSILVNIFIFLKKKIVKTKNFKIPIICVGNIYIGGTGKTPASILICKELERMSLKPALIRKYYKNHKDEHRLIKNYFKNLILNDDRFSAIKEAEIKGFDLAVLDDGFQDYKIKRDLNIICFNQNQLAGNEYIFPAGPLRENLNSLKNAQIILINGSKDFSFEKKLLSINNDLQFFYSRYKPTNVNEFKNKKLLAFAAIGNPENFFNLLNIHNLNVKKKLVFPDHYEFKKSEILNIITTAERENSEIVMTEKDYFKVKDMLPKKLKYLKIELEIENKTKFIEKIKEII